LFILSAFLFLKALRLGQPRSGGIVTTRPCRCAQPELEI
jgi:hypothetical protein